MTTYRISLITFVVGLLLGSYLTPTKVVTVTQTVEVTKEVEVCRRSEKKRPQPLPPNPALEAEPEEDEEPTITSTSSAGLILGMGAGFAPTRLSRDANTLRLGNEFQVEGLIAYRFNKVIPFFTASTSGQCSAGVAYEF